MTPLVLDAGGLHPAITDPAVESVGFLNEALARYPDAISFAPGAPHASFVDAVDLDACVRRFVAHLERDRGLDAVRARRRVREYGPSRGIIGHLVAEALTRDHGFPVDESAVLITAGCQEGMLLAVRALCAGPGDLLAVVDPSFVGILGAARLLGVPVVPVPETAGGLDLDELRRLCRTARDAGRRVRALYVAPDHANPSGTVLDHATRLALLELAAREDLVLLEDIAYGFTGVPGAAPPSLKALDRDGRVVVLGTFAKVCLPGARVGFVVADQRVRDARTGRVTSLAGTMAALKTMVTVSTSAIAQAVIGGLLLQHGGSLAELGRLKAEVYRRNLALLLGALDRHLDDAGPGVSWNRPTGGFFVRMRIPVRADMGLLERCAREHRVLWTPMAPFYLGATGDNELRLACSYLDPPEIEEGARRLAGFLREVRTA
ncbi:PLP-dependent aminotransferase family protein [Streptomyces roseirectus]|uniref:PLP-dependent aminotransferase family protein n=1 Tax=Streptomyces roseirectus TaxID=2768066 RepID=A0A7H0IQN1_9ACTN|nr:PLP-dependent aminotransferase family protein [Streptomyces roseirectus]QNP75097.1 PLP-dependent aminotransferase family protein [Streptomyces roseirectus]